MLQPSRRTAVRLTLLKSPCCLLIALRLPCCAATPDNDLDRELLQHRQEQAGALSGTSSSLLARVRRYLRPPREELEAMPFGERMRYEMINSFLQVCPKLWWPTVSAG